MIWMLLIVICTQLIGSTSQILKFNEQGTFKIAQFTDLHFDERIFRTYPTRKVMDKVLASEPDIDLVVMTGDMVSGHLCPHKEEGNLRTKWFKTRLSEVISQVHKHNVQYAAILGNHDTSTFLPRRDFLEWMIESGGDLSLTKLGPVNITGASNYFLPIGSSATNQEAARLWFFDSMRNACEGNAYSWGCVSLDTVAWFDLVAANLTTPGVAFVHIPLPEFLEAWRNSTNDGVGGKYETIGCPRENTHLFEKLRMHHVTSVYSGHDHLNDFVVTHKGIRLAYGRTTGYGGYPPRGLKGSRIIVLKEGQPTREAETYLRLEDGTKLNQLERETAITAWQWSCAAGPYAEESQQLIQPRMKIFSQSGVYGCMLLFFITLSIGLMCHKIKSVQRKTSFRRDD